MKLNLRIHRMDFRWLVTVSDGTLLGSFLLQQKFIEQRVTCDRLMGVKYIPLAEPQMI